MLGNLTILGLQAVHYWQRRADDRLYTRTRSGTFSTQVSLFTSDHAAIILVEASVVHFMALVLYDVPLEKYFLNLLVGATPTTVPNLRPS